VRDAAARGARSLKTAVKFTKAYLRKKVEVAA